MQNPNTPTRTPDLRCAGSGAIYRARYGRHKCRPYQSNILKLEGQSLKPIIAVFAATAILFGCGGGGKLVPQDLASYISANLKTPEQNVEVTAPFRTTVKLKVSYSDIASARSAGRDLVNCCVEYLRRDNVTNFLNDTLVFVVRLTLDPKQNLIWRTVAYDMRELLEGKMTTEEFFERCSKEENWIEDYEEFVE